MQCELCENEEVSKCDCCELFYCNDCVEWIEWSRPWPCRVNSHCWVEGWVHKTFDVDFLRIKGFINEKIIAEHGPYKPCESIPNDVC